MVFICLTLPLTGTGCAFTMSPQPALRHADGGRSSRPGRAVCGGVTAGEIPHDWMLNSIHSRQTMVPEQRSLPELVWRLRSFPRDKNVKRRAGELLETFTGRNTSVCSVTLLLLHFLLLYTGNTLGSFNVQPQYEMQYEAGI